MLELTLRVSTIKSSMTSLLAETISNPSMVFVELKEVSSSWSISSVSSVPSRLNSGSAAVLEPRADKMNRRTSKVLTRHLVDIDLMEIPGIDF